MERLQSIIESAISRGNIESAKFASCKHINLGLESSLRAINNKQTSCVFISLSIKPHHIVSLISRNAEGKDETQPIYAQPRLEDFTEKIFGIRALCMVLPKNLKEISEDLFQWVEQRKKHKRSTDVREYTSTKKCKSKIRKTEKNIDSHADKKMEDTKVNITTEDKSWKGEYISFDDDSTRTKKFQVVEDENDALDTLSRIMDSVPKLQSNTAEEVEPMEVVENNSDVSKAPAPHVESEDSVDFLDDYKSLIVHKIKPNPNRKPKKKRNKNKNVKK